MSAPNPAVVELRDIRLSFDEKLVLDGVSVRVEPLDRVVVMGQSGSGKSTILRLILGILQPDRGQVFFKQFEISRLNRRKLQQVRTQIGMVYQYSALLSSRNVRDNVALPLEELTKKTREEIDRIVDEKLELVGLLDSKNEAPSELSGGMRKRVSLARALVMEPELILFDEPSAGLAPQARAQVFEVLGSLRGGGWTILLVEQNARSGLSIADCGAVLDAGVVKLEKPATSLLADPEVARLYLGARRDPVGVSTNRPPERPAASTRVTATRKEKPVE